MTEFFLFIIAGVLCLIGLKLIMLRSGNHDADFFLKIVGLILFIPSIYIILETLKVIK